MNAPQLDPVFQRGLRDELVREAQKRPAQRKARLFIVGGLSLGLVAAGGTAVAGSFSNPEAGPLPPGVEVVTQQVYDDAYADFEACMAEAGAPVFAKRTVGQVKEFSYAVEAQPVYDECYVDFAPVDFRWQVAHSFESETFARYRECLVAIGVEPGGDAETILSQVEESGLDVRQCFER